MTQLAIDFDRPAPALTPRLRPPPSPTRAQPLALATAPGPEIAQGQIDRLVSYLAARGWSYRRDIESDTGWNERTVRAIASAARPRIVSYPGSPGYTLWELCTPDEQQHCINAFRSVRDDANESFVAYSSLLSVGHRHLTSPLIPEGTRQILPSSLLC